MHAIRTGRSAPIAWSRWACALNDLGDPYAGIAYDFPGRSAIDWGVYGVPETFVLDHRGMIRYKQIGPMDREALETKILPIVERLQTEARQPLEEPG